MINSRLSGAVWAAALLSSGCLSQPTQPTRSHLSEDEIINLMENPKSWDGKVVRIKIFPYDNGFKTSYVVCFEACDKNYAERSPFIIITNESRFEGFKGDRSVIVDAKYSSACFYTSALCADNRFGEFTEIR